MSRRRRKFSSKFKAKVAMESLSEKYTMAELADRHGVHPNQISQWKRLFLDNADAVFEKGVKSKRKDHREREEL